MNITDVLDKLDGVFPVGEQFQASCPAHLDNKQSLSIAAGQKCVLLRCHAGCTFDEIASSLNVRMSDLFYTEEDWERHKQESVYDGNLLAPFQAKPKFEGTWQMVEEWKQAMTPEIYQRLYRLRGWSKSTLDALDIGFCREYKGREINRITIPIKTASGNLIGVRFYQPNPDLRDNYGKMFHMEGTIPSLFPDIASITMLGSTAWVVEGEPDAITAYEVGIPAVSMPGSGRVEDSWIEDMVEYYVDKLVIFADPDFQGARHTSNLEKKANEAGIKTVVLGNGLLDFSDMIRAITIRRSDTI